MTIRNCSIDWGLHRTLVRAGFEYFCVRIRNLHQAEIRLLDGLVCVRETRLMIRNPAQECSFVLNGRGGIRRRNYVEARGDDAVGTAFALARIMRRQNQEL